MNTRRSSPQPPDNEFSPHDSTSNTRDVDEASEAAMQYLDDPNHVPTNLSPAARRLIEAIAAGRNDQATFDRVARQLDEIPDPPPLEHDSLAVALGLVSSDHVTLSGPQLKKARQKARSKPSVVANQLRASGHAITAGELQRWENEAAVTISSSVMNAIAAVLNVTAAALSTQSSPTVSYGLAMSRQFRHLVRRWAEHTHKTLIAAQTELLQVAAAPARRGTARDDAAVIAALQSFVDAHTKQPPT